LLLVAIDMLSNRRQQRKEKGSDLISAEDNVAIFPLAIPLLAGPTAITSVMVVSSGGTGSLKLSRLGLGALAAAMGGYSDCRQPCRGLYRHTRDKGVFPHHRNYSGGFIN
jgi:small neutral amino acid transporter SnatA (MarC family)